MRKGSRPKVLKALGRLLLRRLFFDPFFDLFFDLFFDPFLAVAVSYMRCPFLLSVLQCNTAPWDITVPWDRRCYELTTTRKNSTKKIRKLLLQHLPYDTFVLEFWEVDRSPS